MVKATERGKFRMSHIAVVAALLLCPGYIKKIECRGRLLASSIGAPELVDLAILPKEVGCGIVLRPKAKAGETNLLLETSSGSHLIAVRIERTQDSKCNETVLLNREVRP